jgi:hypothetical protein
MDWLAALAANSYPGVASLPRPSLLHKGRRPLPKLLPPRRPPSHRAAAPIANVQEALGSSPTTTPNEICAMYSMSQGLSYSLNYTAQRRYVGKRGDVLQPRHDDPGGAHPPVPGGCLIPVGARAPRPHPRPPGSISELGSSAPGCGLWADNGRSRPSRPVAQDPAIRPGRRGHRATDAGVRAQGCRPVGCAGALEHRS